MDQSGNVFRKHSNRRSFLKNGVAVAGAATVGAGLLTGGLSAFGQEKSEGLTKGDAAILQLLLAAEIIETDLWQQYRELGGVEANGSARRSLAPSERIKILRTRGTGPYATRS